MMNTAPIQLNGMVAWSIYVLISIITFEKLLQPLRIHATYISAPNEDYLSPHPLFTGCLLPRQPLLMATVPLSSSVPPRNTNM